MATFQNNKKKTSFHTKLDYFSCMAKFSMTDSGTLPHLRGSSLQQLVAVESSKELHLMCLRPIGVIFASCCGNSNIFSGKIKIGWKWPWLEGGLGYFFVLETFHFFENVNYVSLTFCFISKINYKNENLYHCRFHLPEHY